MYRQGDILMIRAELPEGRQQIHADGIVQLGELTGHAHRLEGGTVLDVARKADFGDRETVERFLQVGPTGARLLHDEHDTITLPEGDYRVIRQREFDPTVDDRFVSD